MCMDRSLKLKKTGNGHIHLKQQQTGIGTKQSCTDYSKGFGQFLAIETPKLQANVAAHVERSNRKQRTRHTSPWYANLFSKQIYLLVIFSPPIAETYLLISLFCTEVNNSWKECLHSWHSCTI